MNIEEVKMVTDLLQSLGQSGTTGFIWWLILDKLVPVVGWLLTLGALLKWIAGPLLRDYACYNAMSEFRDRLGIGSPGTLSASEFASTRKTINDLITKCGE